MDAAARHQRALNRQTAANWQHFAGHRQRVTELLAHESGRRLCILGAGNCNDLDLEALLGRFSEIALLDLDAESLNAAVARQPEPVRRALDVRTPLDFGGLGPDLAFPSPSPLDARASASALASRLGSADFDVVASACVLSQLIGEVPRRWGASHPRCLELVQFVRGLHLHLMLELLRPGGRGVLVSDMVSSDTCPGLATAPADKLYALMVRLAAQKNFFTGLNPFAVDLLLKKDPLLSARTSEVSLQSPWLWQLGPSRTYLTFALTFSRRSETPLR